VAVVVAVGSGDLLGCTVSCDVESSTEQQVAIATGLTFNLPNLASFKSLLMTGFLEGRRAVTKRTHACCVGALKASRQVDLC
jgi:hypothetical protein